MSTAPRRSEITALRQAILDTGSVEVKFVTVWRLWSAAAPRLVGDPSQAETLNAALYEIARQDVIELPKRAWDTSTVPAQPRYVRIPSARRNGRERAWSTFPWRAELGWVASLPSLTDAVFTDLVAINDWLSRTGSREVPLVPVRYRSAEIFGKEKRLDALTRTSLFAPDRLSLSLLACKRIAPPIPAAVVGIGPDVLVVENSDTYWVAVDALRNTSGHTIGAVAWGSGKTFPAQASALAVDIAGQGPLRGTAWYWGDFDPPGVSTPATAAQVAPDVPIRPATGLWAAMANLPAQETGETDWSGADGAEWLGTELWARLEHVRYAQGRIAQELVPVKVVAAWAEALGDRTQI